MTKTFCDKCHAEITDGNCLTISDGNRLAVSDGKCILMSTQTKMRVEIKINNDDGYDWCKHCVIDLINTIDDRPKTSPLAISPPSG